MLDEIRGVEKSGNSTRLPVSIAKDTTTDNVLSNGPWTVNLRFFSSIIPMDDIFTTILGVMSMPAVPPSDQVATIWSYHFRMLNTAYLCEPKRPNIFLKWENMIKALADVPRAMVRKQLFSEMHMDFVYEGRDVGSATLMRMVLGSGSLQLPAKVSVP